MQNDDTEDCVRAYCDAAASFLDTFESAVLAALPPLARDALNSEIDRDEAATCATELQAVLLDMGRKCRRALVDDDYPGDALALFHTYTQAAAEEIAARVGARNNVVVLMPA